MDMNDNINGRTAVLGLLGDPVEHTLSPVIHNSLAELLGDNVTYVPFRVKAEELDSAVAGAYALNIRGLNVTVPHKINVMRSLCDIDEAARAIGAVNTLVRTDRGYMGYNTDYKGLERALAHDGINLSGRSVVIFGAGGAARSAAFLCAFAHASAAYIVNRSMDKAEALCDDVNRHTVGLCRPIAQDSLDSVPGDGFIAIQATSVGLYPDISGVILPDGPFYDRVEYGYDLVYNPAETRFMQLLKKHGARCANGLMMLLYQGIAAYELWNGVSVSRDTAEKVYERLAAAASE